MRVIRVTLIITNTGVLCTATCRANPTFSPYVRYNRAPLVQLSVDYMKLVFQAGQQRDRSDLWDHA